MATIDAQKVAIAEDEGFKRSVGANRLALEEKILNLERAVKFWDEAAERMTIVRRAETKELAESLVAVETSKSQAQIGWDRHEKLSEQLKAVQSDLVKAKEAHAREESNFRNHRWGNGEILLRMHS